MAPPILVTGAAGFAGSHLLDLLEPGDVPVVAWRRPGERLPVPPTGTRCRWMDVELLDADAVRAAVRAVAPGVVYHLAGIAHVGGSWRHTHQTLLVNVLGTHHLLTALAELAVRPRVLITGSAHVYREQDRAITEQDPIGPASPYALSKLAQEMVGAHAASTQGLPVVLTRPFNHIGPRQDAAFFASGVARHIVQAERGLAAPVLEVGNLEARRDLTDVRDTVRAYRALAERGQAGGVYNVCSSRAHRMGDLLDALVAGGRVAIEVRPDPSRLRPHDAPLFLGDHGRLTKEFGWEPLIPIEQTVADLLEVPARCGTLGAPDPCLCPRPDRGADEARVKILVTGASGYLGRAIVAACRAAGHATVSFSRHASASGLPGDLIDGDIRDAAAVCAAARGCDGICHTAALVSVWRPRTEEFDEINVGGLRTVLKAARRAGTPRVLYTSSFLALAPGGATAPGCWNDYQRTKVAADAVATEAVERGAPLIRAYPGVVYGPGPLTDGNLIGRMVSDHLGGRLPGIIGPDCRWSYAFVDDVATAHVAALEHGRVGGRYRLGGENAPQMEVFEIVRELTGCPLPRRLPAWLAVAVGVIEEVRATLTGRPPLLTAGTVEILTRNWPLDSTLAEQELAYRITPLRDGIARVVAALTGGGEGRTLEAAPGRQHA